MTQKEALELFNLDEFSSPEEIKKQYRALFSDYQLRLTNAPTPQLKKLYKKNIQDLDAAVMLLCPEITPDQLQDLPTDTPNYEFSLKHNQLSRTTNKQNTTSSRKTNKSLVLFTTVISFVAIAFIAGGIYVYMKYLAKTEEYVQLEKQFKSVTTENEVLKQVFSPFAENGKLEIQNQFESEIVIRWWSVLYRDQKNKFRNFDSGYYGYPQPKIRKGSSLKLFHMDSQNNVIWDGSVVYYSILVHDQETGREYNFSGIWSEKVYNRRIIIKPPS